MVRMDDSGKLTSGFGPVDEAEFTPAQADALMRSPERGEQQFLAGEAIAGAEVFAWMRSWGTAQELPVPQWKPRQG